LRDALAFGLLVEEPVLLPAIAVTARLVAAAPDPLADCGVALERDGAREVGHLQVVLVEKPHDPPVSRAAAVLVNGLHREVRMLGPEAVRDLAELLVPAVAELGRVLGSLLVVHAEADRDARVVRPADARRHGAVADEVSVHLVSSKAMSFGSRSCQSVASWNAWPMRSTLSSAPGRPTIAAPTGS